MILIHFSLEHWIARHFQDLGCVGLTTNLLLIRVFSHHCWVHVNEHTQGIYLIYCMVRFHTRHLASTFDIFSSISSSRLIIFQTMGNKFKTLRLPIFPLVFVTQLVPSYRRMAKGGFSIILAPSNPKSIATSSICQVVVVRFMVLIFPTRYH